MNHLHRELAPISSAAWEQIDAEARRSLTNSLAARRLVDFEGAAGWETGAVTTGRIESLTSFVDGVIASTRRVRPMVELRTEFTLQRSELDAVDRGARDPDLSPLIDAARRASLAEDHLVFDGYPGTGILGLASASPHDPIGIVADYGRFPSLVARAIAAMRAAGVDGPYSVALGPRCFTGVIESTEHGGYPVLEHLRLITGGPAIWAPALDGSLVVSQRGDDFRLTVGQDLAIGYLDHTRDSVTLYIEESLTFGNDTPEAAVPLRYL